MGRLRQPAGPGRVLRLAGWTLLVAAAPLAAQGRLELGLQRGLEYHSGSLGLDLAAAADRDSLALRLDADGLSGFRAWNDATRRLTESLRLDGFHRLAEALSGRLRVEQSLYNEKRSLRETLQGAADAGLLWRGPLTASLLAGWMREQRQLGGDHGPRLELGLSGQTAPAGWRLDGEGLWRADNPGDRRNRELSLALDAVYDEGEAASNRFRLAVERGQEDFFPEPTLPAMERRGTQVYELSDRLRSRLATGVTLEAGLEGWSRRLGRERAAGDSRALDRGVRLELEGAVERGRHRGRLSFSLDRQQEENDYRSSSGRSETLSRIQVNRLEGDWLWKPAADSLLASARVELRRRDTDFDGAVRRDPDYLDQLAREGRLTFSRRLAAWARLALELSLKVEGERHLQASRSRANSVDRRWSAGARHALAPATGLRLKGRAQVQANYRLYDHDEAGLPRSWLQRRFSWEEGAGWDLPVAGEARWTLELDGGWILEDGGSFRREDGRELLSDSAEERRLGAGLLWRRGGWRLRPGWSWTGRRDWAWSLESGERRAAQVRDLFRRGPTLQLERSGSKGTIAAQLLWERVDDGGLQGVRPVTRNLWAKGSARLDF